MNNLLSGTTSSNALGSRFDSSQNHPYFPTPDQHGELLVDPEIALKAQNFNLDISLSYSTSSTVDRELGVGRSATVRGYIVSMVRAPIAVVRGDLKAYSLALSSASGTVSNYVGSAGSGLKTTFSYDSASAIWTEYFADGIKIEYSEHAPGGTTHKYEINRVLNPSGTVQTYTYGTATEAGLIKTIEVAGGRKVTFGYTAGTPCPLMTTIQDWGGRTWTLAYDASRYLTTFTAPNGCVTKYSYAAGPSGKVLVSAIEDPRGYRTSYSYDGSDRVVNMIAGTAVWTYAYATNQQVVTTPAGAVTTFNYGAVGDVTSIV